MPIYEYTCQECDTRFEVIRTMKDADADLACENCQSHAVKRSLSLFNASSEGRSITSHQGCQQCSGGSCSSCGSQR